MLIVNKQHIERALVTYKASKVVRDVFEGLISGTKCSDCILKEHNGLLPSACAHGNSQSLFLELS